MGWAWGSALPDTMHALDVLWSFLFLATPALMCECVGLGGAWRDLFRANAGEGGGDAMAVMNGDVLSALAKRSRHCILGVSLLSSIGGGYDGCRFLPLPSPTPSSLSIACGMDSFVERRNGGVAGDASCILEGPVGMV